MIDRPKGKAEELMDRFYKFCGRILLRAKEESMRKWLRSGAAIASVIICCFVIVGYVTPETVTVIVDTSLEEIETEYETTSRTVDAFIKDHEIDYVTEVDDISVELDAKIKDGMEIRITKAIDIKITADGKTTELTTLPLTAGEAIDMAGVKVGKDDIVEPAQDTELVTGDEVVVKRVTFGKVSEKETVSYKTVYQEDSSMTIGDMQLTQSGEDGLLKKTYKVKYIDGKEADRQLIATKTLKTVKDHTYSYGTNISFGDAPPSYEKVYTNVRAVSYYFEGTPYGAYGQPCEFGTCAVDPNLIPLGSLLYIEGYGYAIANDVGTSIKGKTVDLYMERYDQCLMWGAHSVNVYVVDEA